MSTTLRFGILLMPNFTLTALAGFVDMLRLSADSGDNSMPVRCQWTFLSSSGSTTNASNGLAIHGCEPLGDPNRFQYIVVVGGLLKDGVTLPPDTQHFLQQAATANITIVGLCTGMFYMAKAGLLTNHRVCVSWFHYWDFVGMFPNLRPQLISADRLYEIDRQRITCAGGRASIDVAAVILKRHLDHTIVNKALHILLLDQADSLRTPQPHPPWVHASSEHPLVRRAILIMVQEVPQGFNLPKIAQQLAISERQLQRLFQEEEAKTPRQFFNELKLKKAVWLLLNTERLVADIAQVSGFADASHLGRSVKAKYGATPSEIRSSASLREHLAEQHKEFYPQGWGHS